MKDFGNNGNMEMRWSKVVSAIKGNIEKNEKRLTDQDDRDQTDLEWKQVALVSDRVLLCVFFIVTSISTAVILCSSPPLDDIVEVE